MCWWGREKHGDDVAMYVETSIVFTQVKSDTFIGKVFIPLQFNSLPDNKFLFSCGERLHAQVLSCLSVLGINLEEQCVLQVSAFYFK